MICRIRNLGRAPNGALLCSTRQQVRLENQLPTWLAHTAGKLGLAVDREPWFLSMNLPGLHHNTAAKSLPQTKCSKTGGGSCQPLRGQVWKLAVTPAEVYDSKQRQPTLRFKERRHRLHLYGERVKEFVAILKLPQLPFSYASLHAEATDKALSFHTSYTSSLLSLSYSFLNPGPLPICHLSHLLTLISSYRFRSYTTLQ